MLTFCLFRSQNYERQTWKIPFMEGYTTVWKNQNNILGGRLLLFIRTDIVFEKLFSLEKAGMEILSVHLKTTKSNWLELYNVKLLDTSTQHNFFDSSLIKPGLSSLILGDHSQCRIHFHLQSLVAKKLLNRFSIMTCIFSMMALLLKLVESPVTIPP